MHCTISKLYDIVHVHMLQSFQPKSLLTGLPPGYSSTCLAKPGSVYDYINVETKVNN